VLARAVLTALAGKLTSRIIDAAIDQRITDLRAQRVSGHDRRQTLTRELQDIAAQQANLAKAIARAGELDALLMELKNADQEKATRRAELARLDAAAGGDDVTLARLRRRMQARAARLRHGLDRNADEARETLAAFTGQIDFTPFGEGPRVSLQGHRHVWPLTGR
jgi:septal ring factor EnvC (AmiA/AmiB activator)